MRSWTVRIDQQIVGRMLDLLAVDTQVQRQMSLRIEVDKADAPAGLGDSSAEIDRRGRLAHAPFLVHYGDAAKGMFGCACGVGHSDQYIDRPIRSRP